MMENQHNASIEYIKKVERELKVLAELMLQLLLKLKEEGKIDEEEYNNLAEKKIEFLSKRQHL